MEHDLKKQYEESKRIIHEASKNNQLVIFVGSGCSIPSGMPSWGEAINKIAKCLEIESSSLSTSDFLRIPQYYYNTRGKKEYTQLMHEIFLYRKYLCPTSVHDLIIQFDTQTIITTNYDHLLEMAAERKSVRIRGISKDSDLPYRKSERELIKIHGDFENDNFVLKEDDYLNYSRNFKLIENYVKSIIGTKVILFVGYSFNDPDVKQIFSWAKDILHGDFQPAYLIETKSEYDKNVENYFKNFGINILFSSVQLEGNFNQDQSRCTEEMLNWLKKEKSLSALDELYNRLKIFCSFNYSYQSIIEKTLRSVGFFYDNGYFYVNDKVNIQDERKIALKKIIIALAYEAFKCNPNSVYFYDGKNKILAKVSPLEDLTEEDRIKIKEIFSILNRSYGGRILIFDHPVEIKPISSGLEDYARQIVVYVELNKVNYPKWLNYLIEFNNQELRTILNSNSARLSENNPDLYMEQACIYVYFKEFFAAYHCLKLASSIYYKKNDSVKYFIAETDRFYVGQIIKKIHLNGVDSKEVFSIENEIELIDLDKTYRSLPQKNYGMELLKDISSFNISYKLFQNAYEKTEKIKNEAQTSYFLYTGIPAYEILSRGVQDYFLFNNLNYLTLDFYVENTQIYKLYLQSILNSILYSGGEKTSDYYFNVHADELTKYELFIALKYISLEDLDSIFSSVTYIPIKKDGIEYLKKVLVNVEKPSIDLPFSELTFWKILIILGHIKIDSSLYSLAIKKLNAYIEFTDYFSRQNSIKSFLINADRCNCVNGSNISDLKILFTNFLECVINNSDFYKRFKRILILLASICFYHKFQFDDLDKCKKLISNNLKIFCALLYPFMSKELKAFVKREFKNYKIKKSFDDFDFYCIAVQNRIIKTYSEAESLILEYCEQEFKNNKSVNSLISNSQTPYKFQPTSTKDEYIWLIRQLASFHYLGYIKDNDSFVKTLKDINDQGSLWLYSPNSFDYSCFDVKWLSEVEDMYLVKILKDKKIREKIMHSILSSFKEGKSDNYIISRVMKFCNYSER